MVCGRGSQGGMVLTWERTSERPAPLLPTPSLPPCNQSIPQTLGNRRQQTHCTMFRGENVHGSKTRVNQCTEQGERTLKKESLINTPMRPLKGGLGDALGGIINGSRDTFLHTHTHDEAVRPLCTSMKENLNETDKT